MSVLFFAGWPYPIEIYSDDRAADFAREDRMTPEERRAVEDARDRFRGTD